MAAGITIQGGGGGDTINFSFTAYGVDNIRYSQQIANAINSLLAGGDSLTQVQAGYGQNYFPSGDADTTPIYDLARPDSIDPIYNIASAGYVIDTVGGNQTINLDSAGGDSVIVAAINPETTVNAAGGDNLVVFVDGNNVYNGDSTNGDTVVTGTGFDTVNTGTGNTTVFSGTGDATINLNDTGTPGTPGTFNDYVYIEDGHDIVNANGAYDAVIANTEGETITGAGSATGNLAVVLLPNTDSTANGNDSIISSGGTTSVYDLSSNNTVFGSTDGSINSVLYFVAQNTDTTGMTTLTATVEGGVGQTYIFGGANTDVVMQNQTGYSGPMFAFASGGNETLDGSMATANEYLYGNVDSSTAGTDVLIGGAGNDILTAGVGTESLTGGAGNNTFFIDSNYTDSSSNITVTDFLAGGNNQIALAGFTQQDITDLLNGTVTSGNYVATLSNGVTLTFDGVTSASQLSGHIVTF
jgi:hypothetical protein